MNPDLSRRVAGYVHQGYSCAQIAKLLDIRPQQVGKLANAAGVSFSAEQTRVAVAARQDQAAAARSRLELALLQEAERVVTASSSPGMVYTFTKDGEYVEQPLSEPVPADQLRLLQAAQTAITTSLRISTHDGSGDRQVVSLLQQTAEALGLTDGG